MYPANCQMGGVNIAPLDVCKTPVGPSIVPIPYVNVALGATAIPVTAAMNVLICGTPAHNMRTIIPLSNGDNPGVALGVQSQRVMGTTKFTEGANNVRIGGSPATYFTCPTGQNG